MSQSDISIGRGPDPRSTGDPLGPLHEHWKSYALQGALMAAIGTLAIFVPWAATLATTLFFGWLLIMGGVLGLIATIRSWRSEGSWSHILLPLLALVLGVVIIADPFAGSITLTWVLALFFLLSGLGNLAISRILRVSTGRFWLIAISGVVDIALAVFLVFGLPTTAIWSVGPVIGISLATSGVALLAAALDARHHHPAA